MIYIYLIFIDLHLLDFLVHAGKHIPYMVGMSFLYLETNDSFQKWNSPLWSHHFNHAQLAKSVFKFPGGFVCFSVGFPLEISTIPIQPSHTPNAGFGGHSSRLTFLRPRPKTAETSLPECGCENTSSTASWMKFCQISHVHRYLQEWGHDFWTIVQLGNNINHCLRKTCYFRWRVKTVTTNQKSSDFVVKTWMDTFGYFLLLNFWTHSQTKQFCCCFSL